MKHQDNHVQSGKIMQLKKSWSLLEGELQKSIKTIRQRKIRKLFLFLIATQWSFTPLSADKETLSFIHSFIHTQML